MNRYEWAAFGVILASCALCSIVWPSAINRARIQAIEDAHMRISAAVVELRREMREDRPESER